MDASALKNIDDNIEKYKQDFGGQVHNLLIKFRPVQKWDLMDKLGFEGKQAYALIEALFDLISQLGEAATEESLREKIRELSGKIENELTEEGFSDFEQRVETLLFDLSGGEGSVLDRNNQNWGQLDGLQRDVDGLESKFDFIKNNIGKLAENMDSLKGDQRFSDVTKMANVEFEKSSRKYYWNAIGLGIISLALFLVFLHRAEGFYDEATHYLEKSLSLSQSQGDVPLLPDQSRPQATDGSVMVTINGDYGRRKHTSHQNLIVTVQAVYRGMFRLLILGTISTLMVMFFRLARGQLHYFEVHQRKSLLAASAVNLKESLGNGDPADRLEVVRSLIAGITSSEDSPYIDAAQKSKGSDGVNVLLHTGVARTANQDGGS